MERLIDVLFDEGTYYAQSKFERGYQLGVPMTMEVFEALDAVIIKETGGKKNEAEKERLLAPLVKERMRATLDVVLRSDQYYQSTFTGQSF